MTVVKIFHHLFLFCFFFIAYTSMMTKTFSFIVQCCTDFLSYCELLSPPVQVKSMKEKSMTSRDSIFSINFLPFHRVNLFHLLKRRRRISSLLANENDDDKWCRLSWIAFNWISKRILILHPSTLTKKEKRFSFLLSLSTLNYCLLFSFYVLWSNFSICCCLHSYLSEI